MRKIVIFIFLASIITISSSAAYKQKEINRTRLLDYLNQCNTFMVEGNADGTPITSIQYELMSLRMKRWLSDNYIELKTNLSREWLEGIANSLVDMNKHKLLIETAKANRTTYTDEFKANKEAFFKSYSDFSALLKSPQAPSKETLIMLRKKLADQKAEERKLQAGNRK